MSKPTLLSPWFAVMRLEKEAEWYTSAENSEDVWTYDRKQAMLFNSIHSAHRVARAEGAYAVVVANEEDMKEYRDA